ncbi:30S ribosomal protein S6 [candidate division WWE3 bacterium]|uniref:Small ribosomal subunit protein bS6 n=1 Tax=candidate division WWE3 bacterium TaxID=2053526 RepID=A0A7X9DKF5_UNCKA|nr:30S ribosomal protein S6 [candidate division WWE3 bacterium]
MKTYELMTIAKASLTDQGAKDLSTQIQDLVKSFNGKIIKQDYWGKRKLAYEINRNTDGYYDVLTVELDSGALDKFKNKLSLLPDLLRYLVTAKS